MASTGSFQILKAKQEFQFKNPIISLGTSPADLVKKLEEVQHVLDQFDQFTGCVQAEIDIKTEPDNPATPGKPKVDLKTLVDSAKQEIICSALKPELLTLYGGSLFNSRLPVATIIANLKQVLGEITPKEAKKQLRAEFMKLTRRCDINETFESFLDRLIAKAAKISNNADFREELVGEQFESSLRPMDNDALEVFLETEATGIQHTRAQAQLLDKKKFFKRSEVETNHLELQEANTILIGQVDNLTRKVESLQSSSEDREDVLTTKVTQLQSQLDQLMRSFQSGNAQMVNSNATIPNSPVATPKSSGDKSKKFDKSMDNKFKDPDFFCYNCGLRKCSNKHKCDGDDSKFCVICQKYGHVATSRKYHKPAGSPQKSKN